MENPHDDLQENFNLELAEKLKNRLVCWYPSSGADFESIDFWFKDFGNNIKPDLFVFTDMDFLINEGSFNIRYQQGINLIDGIKEKGFDLIKLNGNYDELDDYICQNKREIEEICKPYFSELIKDEVENEFLPETTHGISWKEMIEVGILTLKDLEEIGSLKMSIKEFILKYKLFENFSNYSKYEISHFRNTGRNIDLIFIKTKNADFYDFCKNNNIEIASFMLRRPMDSFFFNDFDLNKINIKEAFIRVQDLTGLIMTNYKSVYSFEWPTYHFNDMAELFVKE